MKKFIICCTALLSFAYAQEYKLGLQNKDGFTTIYYTKTPPAANNNYFQKFWK